MEQIIYQILPEFYLIVQFSITNIITNSNSQIEKVMGQQNCCESNQSNKELILNFNSLKTEDPIETSVPANLKKSIPTNIMISKRGFQDGVDGDYLMQQPMITQAVKNRLQNLHSLNIHQQGLQVRGTQQHNYFRFRRTGIVYYGQWKNKVPNGYGKNYYPNGGLYEGGFIEGIPHGFGRFIMPNGQYYQGEIKYGRANGNGVFENEDSKYKGTFKDNVRHGRGQQKGKSFYFQGEYEYGQKKSGILKYQGNVYEGEFLDGQFHGQGLLTNPEGVYKGNFKSGQKDGYGQFKWPNGSLYRGKYHRGNRDGYGQYFNGKNSSISKGIWRQGILNGEGQYIQPDGQVHKVVWSQGKISAIVGN